MRRNRPNLPRRVLRRVLFGATLADKNLYVSALFGRRLRRPVPIDLFYAVVISSPFVGTAGWWCARQLSAGPLVCVAAGLILAAAFAFLALRWAGVEPPWEEPDGAARTQRSDGSDG